MTPAFWDEGHVMLRAQLKCLSVQTAKDFDVWLIDPHYQKRKTVIPELAQKFGLDIKHVPYAPNTRIAKYFDCAIFNAAYCYSDAPVNVRYSCYRFVRPTFVERILSAPQGANVDFYMHAVGPDLCEVRDNVRDKAKHRSVWWFEGEDVDWSRFPTKSGYANETCTEIDEANSLGNWPAFMDQDTIEPIRVPANIYGNIAWNRDQWMAINGTNEVITNGCHWEDLDFDCRAAIAGQKVVRYSHLLYRLHHHYGSHAQRSNVPVDVPFTRMCKACYAMIFCNKGDGDFGRQLRVRLKNAEVQHYYECQVWVCKECLLSGAYYDDRGLDHYFYHLQANRVSRSPVLPRELIGRNLSILADHMDKCPYLSSKVLIYNDSWTNPYYYVP
jgi:hypothetical protein